MNKLRTEIVLIDSADVAFWFSLSFRFAIYWQTGPGKREADQFHRTQAKPKALFPVRVRTEKRIIPGEDARNEK